MNKIDFEDKDLVILVIFVICIVAMLFPITQMASGIIEKAFYLLGGIATGRAISKKP